MARRRRRNSEPDFVGFAMLLLLGMGISLQQKQMNLFWILILLGLIAIAVGLLILYIRIQRNNRLRQSNIAEIDKMSGLEFERYLKLLLIDKGYKNVRLTESYDLGIDIIAEKDGNVWGIQAKRYKDHVGLDSVRQVVAALRHYNCNKAMVITNSYFTRNAQTIAQSMDCILVNRDALVKLILQS